MTSGGLCRGQAWFHIGQLSCGSKVPRVGSLALYVQGPMFNSLHLQTKDSWKDLFLETLGTYCQDKQDRDAPIPHRTRQLVIALKDIVLFSA